MKSKIGQITIIALQSSPFIKTNEYSKISNSWLYNERISIIYILMQLLIA